MFQIHNFLLRHKLLAVVALLCFIGAIVFLALKINLEEDIASLIPSGERQDVLRKVLDQTEFSDKLIITVSSTSEEPDPEEVTLYAQQFLDSLELQLPEYVEDVQGKVPEEGIREIYNFVYNNLPLFLNEDDYSEIEERLPRDSIKNLLEENYKTLISPTGLVTKDFIFKDPLSITSLGLQKLQELQVDEDFELYNNFLITKDHRHVLLFLSTALPASETEENALFIRKLDQIQQNLNQEFAKVEGDYFGGVLYSIANARQIKKDIQLTIGIAACILLFILIFYYRRLYVPLVLFLPVVIGGLTAVAALYLIKDTVSAISLGIGAILLGISIDYSLHILTHFKSNRNVGKLYREVTGPVLMSSFTTAIAFLCLLFVRSEALNDLGIFAAISVVVSSIFALILIPLLYKIPETIREKPTFIDKISSFSFHKNNPLVIIISLMFVIGLFTFTSVNFNSDLAELNYEPEEIKIKEQKVQQIAGRAAKSIYLVSYGNSIDEALENNNELYGELQELEEEGEISNFSSIGGVVLSTRTQLERITRWNEFWTEPTEQQVRKNLVRESDSFGFRAESFDSFYNLLSENFETLYLDDYRNISILYLDDFISSGENFATVTTSINVEPENLQQVIDRFDGRDNTVVIDRKQLNETFLGNLKNDFNRLIGYSLLAVFLMLLFFYRSIELTLLTLIPIGVTWVIALGLMAILKIDFNILNIIISTFIFGLGLDYSIFITNAFLKEYESSTKVLNTYRTSILLSVITTLLGIGALFFAKHPVLRSISVVSIIGILAAVSVAFVIQGFIFDRLFVKRKKEGRPPFSLSSLYYRSKFIGNENQLYFKKEVYDNYRYKKAFDEVKREFETDKERYLKIAEFLDEKDQVLHIHSGYGVLPVFLSYKSGATGITGYEPDPEKSEVAENTFRNTSNNLSFT
ncbi:MMPL family transporter [Antarcticibacterium sp. 1MA-6-2]|uniref:MMPL family transporter n=1 Tax=Antarcticibacterium sp. 1MA-6-2 TaxID=2908210 RepID=UPI001F431AE6|nr:MMPL family transporter [Antarcticibacterium sp. 1MA-6-2]UJH91637.1 MMPL family transporter [Antarcticibacterium sp. 1MA-6-2]